MRKRVKKLIFTQGSKDAEVNLCSTTGSGEKLVLIVWSVGPYWEGIQETIR